MLKMIWHVPTRIGLTLWTAVPIYLRYLFIWLRYKRSGRWPAPEKLSAIHRKSAEKFFRLAVRMRGGLIKVGQIISTRVDLMPTEWVEVLSRLQDRVDPQPWKVIAKRVEAELGEPPEIRFAEFSKEAIAAASFGQVHRAKTHEGLDVAVKIQYADVDMKLACDLFTLRVVRPFFNIFVPKIPLKQIQEEINQALVTELDYEQEAEYTKRIGANLANVPDVFVPKVIDAHTSEHVICTTFFDGFRITDGEKLDALGITRLSVIQKIIEAYAEMFFVSGVFQSDPHPGNLLVRAKEGQEGVPEVCILDFGQVKVLPDDFQQKLVMTSVAFIGRDVDGFLRSVVGMGVVSERDAALARPLIKTFFDEMFEMSPNELKRLDADELRERVKTLVKEIEGVHIPQDIVLYGRAFSLLAGVIAALDPDVNGIIVAKPMIMKALFSPKNFPAAAPKEAPKVRVDTAEGAADSESESPAADAPEEERLQEAAL